MNGRSMSDEELEKLLMTAADKAAKQAVSEALQAMYVEIGRGVLRKAAYVIGIGIIALGLWLTNHGFK